MAKAEKILEFKETVGNGKFLIQGSVYRGVQEGKYPGGVKCRFVIVDIVQNKPIYLIDNHEPFGFHEHLDPYENKDFRRSIKAKNAEEAKELFFEKLEEILNER